MSIAEVIALKSAIEKIGSSINERFAEEQKETLEKVEGMLNDLIPNIKESIKNEVTNQVQNFKAEFNGDVNVTHKQPEPDAYTKISNYLSVLIGAQHSGHKLHDEIDEALKKLKDMAFA